MAKAAHLQQASAVEVSPAAADGVTRFCCNGTVRSEVPMARAEEDADEQEGAVDAGKSGW